jgi:hypothetical protein
MEMSIGGLAMFSFMRILVIAIFSLSMLLAAKPALTQEAAALTAAENILRDLGTGKILDVWEHRVSKFTKDRMPKDAFLAQMSMARTQLGDFVEQKLVSTQHADRDPQSGFVGDIYFVMFRATYSAGEYFVSVAVVKDNDGEYRYSGIFGSPVPKN